MSGGVEQRMTENGDNNNEEGDPDIDGHLRFGCTKEGGKKRNGVGGERNSERMRGDGAN
jgi:hypothetical protein